GFVRCEVIEQQVGGAAVEGFVEFLASADFDLDGESAGACAFEGIAHTSGGGDVIVLDQDGVVQAHAVIGDAARGRGGFFQGAEARCGFASIEDLAVRTPDRGGEPAGGGGYAAEALQEIEGDAFAGE